MRFQNIYRRIWGGCPIGREGLFCFATPEVGQCADVGESARLEVIEVNRSAGAGFNSLRTEADIGQRACVVINEGEALLLHIVEPEGQRSAVGKGLIVDFDGAPRIGDVVPTGVCPCACKVLCLLSQHSERKLNTLCIRRIDKFNTDYCHLAFCRHHTSYAPFMNPKRSGVF